MDWTKMNWTKSRSTVREYPVLGIRDGAFRGHVWGDFIGHDMRVSWELFSLIYGVVLTGISDAIY